MAGLKVPAERIKGGLAKVATFKSADAYSQFAREVRTTDRHIRDANALEFLATLLAQAVRDRRRTIPKERILWRAQLGNDWSRFGREKSALMTAIEVVPVI